jgi:hypothetical protein
VIADEFGERNESIRSGGERGPCLPLKANRGDPDWLTVAAVAYLALPNIAFFLMWVEPVLSVPVVAALLFALGRLCRVREGVERTVPKWSVIAFVTVVATIWTAFGGAGHFGYANTDWPHRDAVYGDLIRYDWPLLYRLEDGSVGILRTAMGYYLPPSLLSKVVGLQFADLILFAWTATGTSLFMLLLPVHPLRSAVGWIVPLLVVIFFSGMDAIATWVYNGLIWPTFPDHLEWWTVRFQYSSFSTLLLWVPNHALAAWIATALFVRNRQRLDYPNESLLTLSLLPLWSPFAAVGFAPFFALSVFKSMRRERALRVSPFTIVVSGVLAYVVGRLLTSGSADIPHAVGAPLLASYFGSATAEFFSVYILFVGAEFGVLLMILGSLFKPNRDLLWLSGVILLALPFFRIGGVNDLAMRASIPALTVICLMVIVEISRPDAGKHTPAAALILAATLAAGSVTAVHELGRTLVFDRWLPDYRISQREQQGGLPVHYVGPLKGADLKILLRDPGSVN